MALYIRKLQEPLYPVFDNQRLVKCHTKPIFWVKPHNATATPNACNVSNLTLDHCVSQKWFNAPVAALDLGVRGRKPKRCRVWVHYRV